MDTKMRKKSVQSSSSSSKKFGCRVKFPMYACSFVKREKEDEEEEYERENKKEIRVVCMDNSKEKFMSEREEKDGGEIRVDRMLLDRKFSEKKDEVGTNNISVLSETKCEDQSLNLGMGVGLIFLLSKSSTELNKMVELRKEMETILNDIKSEIKKKNSAPVYTIKNSAPVSMSISEGNENTSNSFTPLRENNEFSNIIDSKLVKGVNEIDEIEAELEAELERMELNVQSKNCLPPLRINQMEMNNTTNHQFTDSFSDSFEEYNNISSDQQLDYEEIQKHEDEDEEINYINNGGGVCPFELERRLQEVLESRQRERIEELESALEFAERKLNEKEREICWWRDTAKLVTQHKDDSHFR